MLLRGCLRLRQSLSTPFWEFLSVINTLNQLNHKLVNFLLPFGSFTEIGEAAHTGITRVGLSTPFWEFPGLFEWALKAIPLNDFLSTPFWEFPP
jgi:hypothetical protein